MIAYWEKSDGEKASYEISLQEVKKGRKGWAAYVVAMRAIGEISAVLRPEGFKLRYRKENGNG